MAHHTQGDSETPTTDKHTLRYKPDPDYHGLDKFTYTVEDAGGLRTVATVTITVTDSGMVITAGQSFSVSETAANGAVLGSVATTVDEPTGFAITAGDPDGAFAIDAAGQITVAD